MEKTKNFLYGILFGALSLFSLGTLNSTAQNVFPDCDYLRKLNVNRRTEQFHEISKELIKNYTSAKEIDFSEPLEDEARNSLEGMSMNIYFPTDKYNLSGRDSSDIKKYFDNVIISYLKQENKISSFNLKGYADCVPLKNVEDKSVSDLYNYNLSHKRAESVANYLDYLIYTRIHSHVNIFISAYGNMYSKKTKNPDEKKEDRKVEFIVNENPIRNALNVCRGKIILGDQSGSMSCNGSPYWKYFQEHPFFGGVDVFTYSEFVPPRGMKKEDCPMEIYPQRFHTYDINKETASGATSYYPAMEKLLSSDIVSEGDTITAIVNGLNDFSNENPGQIIKIAGEKKVVSNIIGLELSGKCISDLMTIPEKTEGKYYFVHRFKSKLF